jgi:hypothetical protein
MHNDFPYDLESYPNVFSAVIVHAVSGREWIFEVSDRVNQSRQLLNFIRTMGHHPSNRMVGYNNVGYDYPLLHALLRFDSFTAADAYQISMGIIETPWNDRFRNNVWASDMIVPQVDLFKIHHFDNVNRMTSLKQIEIALQLPHVADLPFPPGTVLSDDQIPQLLAYNRHDVAATLQFYRQSAIALAFRDEMSAALDQDLINASDSSIGSKVFISRLNAAQPGICGKSGSWRQTPRARIPLADCIFPYVQFQTPEFTRMVLFLQDKVLKNTKGVFQDYETFIYPDGTGHTFHKSETATSAAHKKAGARRVTSSDGKGKVATRFAGIDFVFGTGGIHGAQDGTTWRSTPDRVVQGRDVRSYYPNLAIANRVYPAHLSEVFCDIYKDVYEQRISLPKSDPRNKALKLALNATYGNSNSTFSPFYDPLYTMTITINGQLLLCMLAERLAAIPSLELIQVNTDGIEYIVDQDRVGECDAVSSEWEKLTGLQLESEDYARFHQRDVNSYVAIDERGGVKCKGAFEYQHGLGYGDGWHKNQSCKIVPIAAEAYLVRGVPVADTVAACTNAFHFMHTLKAQRNDRVMLGGDLSDYECQWTPSDAKGRPVKRNMHSGGVAQQRTGRYYVTHTGGAQLWKIMPPLPKLPMHDRPQAIAKGETVLMCNDLYDFDWALLDRDYYARAAQDLVDSTGG